MTPEDIQAAQARLNELRSTRTYAHLSTLNSEGFPLASYAPCLVRDKGIYVFLSQLSGHCKNLLLDNRAGVLLLADESDVRNPFARQRVSYQCEAVVVVAEDDDFGSVLDQLAELHGNTVELLRQLPDFVLFCLRPIAGTYIEGFGKAFDLESDGATIVQHVDENVIRSRH